MRSVLIFVTLMALAVSGPAPAQTVTPIALPSASYAACTAVLPITLPDDSNQTSPLTNGSQTITLTPAVVNPIVKTVGVPSWTLQFWNNPPAVENSLPRVLYTVLAPTDLTASLAVPSRTFGFEAEPSVNNQPTPVTATFFNGTTQLGQVTVTITNPNAAPGGAQLVAATVSTPITRVHITAPEVISIAQIRTGNCGAPPPVPALGIPELAALALVLAGLGAYLLAGKPRHA